VDDKLFHAKHFDQTLLNPLAAILLVLMGVMMLASPRRYAVWPFIVVACFITQAQRITVAGLDFTFLRLMIVFGIVRLLFRDEIKGFKWNRLDWAVIGFMTIRMIWSAVKKTGGISASGMGNSVGNLQIFGEGMDMLGMYFFFRCVVRDLDDVRGAIYGFIFVSVPVAAAFIYEATALHNPFSIFGGVSDVTRNRDGKLRCMGAYSHPILAGVFWAVLLPYMGAMIKQKGRLTFLPFVGIICAAIIIILSGSSSPIAAAGVAFVGGCLFVMRRRMRLLRWGILIMLVGMQLVMARGVWHLLARMNIIGGSTGYYRFKLIDQFISHGKEWFFFGSSKGTSTWEVPMFDIVNYYVILGLSGGILFILLLVWIFVAAYKNVGERVRASGDMESQLFAWALGVAVFVHMVNFLVVAY
jgi:hypothetical protein